MEIYIDQGRNHGLDIRAVRWTLWATKIRQQTDPLTGFIKREHIFDTFAAVYWGGGTGPPKECVGRPLIYILIIAMTYIDHKRVNIFGS